MPHVSSPAAATAAASRSAAATRASSSALMATSGPPGCCVPTLRANGCAVPSTMRSSSSSNGETERLTARTCSRCAAAGPKLASAMRSPADGREYARDGDSGLGRRGLVATEWRGPRERPRSRCCVMFIQ